MASRWITDMIENEVAAIVASGDGFYLNGTPTVYVPSGYSAETAIRLQTVYDLEGHLNGGWYQRLIVEDRPARYDGEDDLRDKN